MTSYSPMNPEVKAAWLKALRSGKYQQGKLWLRQATATGEDKFCCLGVLCDLGKDRAREWVSEENIPLSCTLYRYAEEATHLPQHVRVRSGVCWSVANALAVMNDNGSSFEEIADWIEENL